MAKVDEDGNTTKVIGDRAANGAGKGPKTPTPKKGVKPVATPTTPGRKRKVQEEIKEELMDDEDGLVDGKKVKVEQTKDTVECSMIDGEAGADDDEVA